MTECDHKGTSLMCRSRAVEFFKIGNVYRARCATHELGPMYKAEEDRAHNRNRLYDYQSITEEEFIIGKVMES